MSNRVRVRVIKGFTFCDHFKIAQKKKWATNKPNVDLEAEKFIKIIRISLISM